MGHSAKYDEDFYAWTMEQATRLREAAASGANLPLDWENLAEEIESMGRSDLNGLVSHMARLIEHLVKLEVSTAAYPRNGWKRSVIHQRSVVLSILDGSPSLRARAAAAFDDAWKDGRRLAVLGVIEDGVEETDVPSECPFTLDQLLNRDWWPPNHHGLP